MSNGSMQVKRSVVKEDSIKLFLFCRHEFKSISKTDLHACFHFRSILVNGCQVRKGNLDESMILSKGDVVEINLDDSAVRKNKLGKLDIKSLHLDVGCAIVDRQPENYVQDSDFKLTIEDRFWKDNKSAAVTAHDLEKGTHGLTIVAKNQAYSTLLNEYFISKHLHVIFRCIVCGSFEEKEVGKVFEFQCPIACPIAYLGDVDPSIIDQLYNTQDKAKDSRHRSRKQTVPLVSTLTIKILSVPSRCRSVNYLSVVEVCDGSLSSGSSGINIPLDISTYLSLIRLTMSAGGHSIVGDGNVVKKGKGLFGYVRSIELCPPIVLNPNPSSPPAVSIPTDNTSLESTIGEHTNNTTVSMESNPPSIIESVGSLSAFSCAVSEPRKFEKLLENESKLWEKGNEKNLLVDTCESRDGGGCLDSGGGAVDTDAPLAYRQGYTEFCSLRFAVNSSVMIPRESSGVLVNAAVRHVAQKWGISTDVKVESSVGDSMEVCGEGCAASENGCVVLDSDDVVADTVHKKRRVCGDVDVSSDLPTAAAVAGVESKESVCGSTMPDHAPCLLDLGTGSGCLLLSILAGISQMREKKKEMGSCRGVGVDVSQEAVTVAESNALALGLQSHTTFTTRAQFSDLSIFLPTEVQVSTDTQVGSNSTEAIIEGNQSTNDTSSTSNDSALCSPLWTQDFDVIVCNPPYSTVVETQRLSVNCREHEPSLALFAPPNAQGSYSPVFCYEMVAKELFRMFTRGNNQGGARMFLRLGGLLLFEVGQGLEHKVRTMMRRVFCTSNTGAYMSSKARKNARTHHTAAGECKFLMYKEKLNDQKGMVRCLVYERI